MKTFQIIIDFITSFIITAGGAMFIAMLAAKGQPLAGEAWAAIVTLGFVQAAKGTRNLIGLPPLSNGNYDTLKEILQKSKTGNTDILTKDKP